MIGDLSDAGLALLAVPALKPPPPCLVPHGWWCYLAIGYLFGVICYLVLRLRELVSWRRRIEREMWRRQL